MGEHRACRVTVNVLGVRGMGAQTPLLRLQAEDVSFSLMAQASYEQKEDMHRLKQSHTFDIKDKKTAELLISLGSRGPMGVRKLGAAKPISVLRLLDCPESYSEAAWVDVPGKDTKKGAGGAAQILLEAKAAFAPAEQRISAFVGTWNTGNARPPEDLSPWLGPRGEPSAAEQSETAEGYGLVAIGSQECDYPPRQGFGSCHEDWVSSIRKHYGSRYQLVKAASRGQMRLVVLAATDCLSAVTDVDSASEATGIAHVLANKGAVCISLKFWDTPLCFVTCHLAAHEGLCEARNENYKEICRNMRPGIPGVDLLNQFHHVFWCGDLNYRLNFGKSKPPAKVEDPEDDEDETVTVSPKVSIEREDPEYTMILEKIQRRSFKELLEHDELRREMKDGKAFYKFNEADIDFPPTFKVKRDELCGYSTKRLPGWCDRVLWRSLPGCSLACTSYASAPAVQTSDHKPVAATFDLTTYALPVRMTAEEASGLRQGAPQDDMRWHLRFSSLSGLSLRAADSNGLSDPYVQFVGPELLKSVQTKVKKKTLFPKWSPEDVPAVVLEDRSLKRLEKTYLLVSIYDYDFSSRDDPLGYAALPLAKVAKAARVQKGAETPFRAELTYKGLKAGSLEGSFRLTWEPCVGAEQKCQAM